MQNSVRAAWRRFNESLEGLIPWMYLDVKGLVTTGMGNLIDPVATATPLPWLDEAGNPASTDAIAAEWTTIKTATALARQGAQAAKAMATLHLDDPAIDSLILNKLSQNEKILVAYRPFADFPNWPADAQLGLLSMAWAMGSGFGPGFPRFAQACSAGDFATAAADCQMNAAGNPGLVRRNTANQQAFTFAANAIAQASPEILQSAVPPA
jgi:GH24 family phage-related lysozyme (muramidase)